MFYCAGAKQRQRRVSVCLALLAFGEFPAENTRAWEAERGADKPQTTSPSCISSMHGTFYI